MSNRAHHGLLLIVAASVVATFVVGLESGSAFGLSIAPGFSGPAGGPGGPGGGTGTEDECSPDPNVAPGPPDPVGPLIPNPYIGPFFSPPPGGGGEPRDGWVGRWQTAPAVGLVDPDGGSVRAGASAPFHSSKGARVTWWRDLRTYNQCTAGPGDTAQGYHWLHAYAQDLALADANAPASSPVTWRANARHSYTFGNSGSYTFAPNDSTFAVLSHAHAGDPSDTYRLEFLDGSLMLFWDASHSPTAERLKLYRIEDLYGSRLNVYYDANGRIDYITDPSGHYFRYSYVASGVNGGRIEQIDAWKDSDPNDTTKLIERVDFTYMDPNDASFSADCGSLGDLIQVVVRSHTTGETGDTFSQTRTTHYRYYSGEYQDPNNPGHPHELKMVLGPEHCQRASEDPNVPSLLAASDADIAAYATYKFEYDSSNRCTKMAVLTGGSCCGGGGQGTGIYTFSYELQSSNDRNDWARRCKIERKVNDVAMWTRYIDVNNWGEVWRDVMFTDASDHNKPLWAYEYTRDPNTGQVTRFVTPGAITDYTVNTHEFTYNNDGAVYDYAYDANAKYMTSIRVRKYSEQTGDAKYVRYWEYTALPQNTGYRSTRYVVSKSSAYPIASTSLNDPNSVSTTYAYVCHPDTGDLDADENIGEQTDRPMVIRVTLPTVTTDQYGPNVGGIEYNYVDTAGRVRWTKDAEGAVSYYGYNGLSGARTYAVTDVYTGAAEGDIRPVGITSPEEEGGEAIWGDWTGAAPEDPNDPSCPYDFQTTGSSSDYVQRENKSNIDLQGRTRWMAGPDGVRTYFAYLDSETRTYPAWSATTDKPGLPVRRVLTDKDGHTEEAISVDPTDISFSDPPTGGETLTDQAKWVSWTKTTYDGSLRPSTVQAYHDIPSSGSGTAGTNYALTQYTYADDPNNLVTTAQVADPEGGFTRTTSNAHGQKTKVEITATAGPSNWKTLTEYYYDQATPGAGSSKGGNGSLTQVKSYYDDSNSNSTAYTYDYRGRRLLTSPPAAPHTLTKYDNQDRVVATGTFSAAPAASSDPTATTANRLSLSETTFNNRGQVCETKRSLVNTDGTITSGNNLATKTYYDRTGRVVATVSPGGGAQVSKYNGAGDVVERQTCVSLGSTIYDGTSHKFDYSSDNPVVGLAKFTLDISGRTRETDHYDLEASATGFINPDSIGGDVVQTKTRQYYDAMTGRGTQSTNFGTYPAGGLASPMNATKASIASYDPNAPESRSDTQLVTTQGYDAAGHLATVTDADGIVTKYEYDDLGRRTAMMEDYDPNGTHLNRRTEYQYNGNGDLTKLLAKAVGEYDAGHGGLDDQVTQYIYGSPVNTRWVTEIRYPGTDGQPSNDPNDKIGFTYNNNGTVATRTDQNASVITYDYDSLSRKTHERLTTVGTGVDSAVRQVVTTYDSAGRVSKLTHRDSATADSGNVVNEVQFTHDGLGQLAKDEQEHDGAVDGSTLSVQYAYALSGSAASNYSHLSQIIYPNGRTLYARYVNDPNDSSKQGEIGTAFNRIAQWAGADNDPNVYVSYAFAGLNTLISRKASPAARGNDTRLNYDAGDPNQYAGLDMFGRVASQKVTEAGSSTARDDIQYRSRRDGSPAYAEPQSALPRSRSQVYSYDGLHRLTQADIGRFNDDPNNPALIGEWQAPQAITYTMDILGNITSLDRANSGTSAAETRTYNATNELTSRTVVGEAPRYWVNADFANNNTTDWEVADLNTGGSDGTWSASSGSLSCTGVIAVSGAPGTGYGSILLIDGVRYQDLLLTCSATMTKGAVVGLVFGYVDNQNYWVKLYSLEDGKWYLYRVSGGSWVQRDWESASISDGTPFTMQAEVRAGAVDDYYEALPAGQVGLWSSSASDHSFDDFKVRDIAGPFEVDGRWFCDKGNVHVDAGDSNLLEASGTDGVEDCVVRRGFRGDKYVATYRFKWNGSTSPGWVVRWLSPGDYLAVSVSASDQKARLYQRAADGHLATLAVSAGSVSLSSGTWYEGKVVVDDDPNDAELQQLRFWADNTLLLTTTEVDDEWSAGLVGLYRAPGGSTIQQYDDVKIGYDSNGDGDISDAGDVLQVADDFASSVLTGSFDASGNLAGDGVYRYVYDAWNRLRKVQRVAGHSGQADDVTTIAEYVYLADNRRASKVVSHCGPQEVVNDGGDTTVHFYYSNKWQILETRNGSNQSTRQWVWGTRYVDELVFMDVNGSPNFSNNCDPDVGDAGQGEDRRYFYHQDRNWNVVALTEYDDGVGTDARVVERYAYTPYGEFIVLSGDGGSGELGAVRPTSSVGNPFFHQGLYFDQEKGGYQNRHREYEPERFMQRDPVGYRDGANTYMYGDGSPLLEADPFGLSCMDDYNAEQRRCTDLYRLPTSPCRFIAGAMCFAKCQVEARQDRGRCLNDCALAARNYCDSQYTECIFYAAQCLGQCVDSGGTWQCDPFVPTRPFDWVWPYRPPRRPRLPDNVASETSDATGIERASGGGPYVVVF